MKPHRLTAVLLSLLVVLPLHAAKADGKVYGAALGDSKAVRISDIAGNPDAYVDQRVRVVGLVDDVCPRKGCWVDIIEAQSTDTIRFKVQDDVIVFPVEARGKEIVAEGVLRRHELDREAAVKRLRHLAEEKGEPFDAATVTGPLVFYQIEGAGAVVGR